MSPIANMLIQIKNAQAVSAESVSIPFSNMKYEIAQILKNKNFVGDIEKKKKKLKKAEVNFLDIKLKYDDSVGAISGIKLISKPSRRMYIKKDDIKPVKSGYGISVLSTSKGLMTGENAKKTGLGGELIFEIW